MLPSLLDKIEVGGLNSAVEAVTKLEGLEVARETDGNPNVVYGMHMLDDRFRMLARHRERPEYYAARDFSPLERANKDCLRVFG